MPKWIISKSIEVDASHVVEGYDGVCARLHGHRWKIEISVIVSELNSIGIGVDFNEIKKVLQSLDLDHKHLNDIIYPSTAECIAKYVFDKAKEKGLNVYKVTVWETPSNKIEYFE